MSNHAKHVLFETEDVVRFMCTFLNVNARLCMATLTRCMQSILSPLLRYSQTTFEMEVVQHFLTCTFPNTPRSKLSVALRSHNNDTCRYVTESDLHMLGQLSQLRLETCTGLTLSILCNVHTVYITFDTL